MIVFVFYHGIPHHFSTAFGAYFWIFSNHIKQIKVNATSFWFRYGRCPPFSSSSLPSLKFLGEIPWGFWILILDFWGRSGYLLYIIYPIQLSRDYFIGHYKDPYEPIRISWNVSQGFFETLLKWILVAEMTHPSSYSGLEVPFKLMESKSPKLAVRLGGTATKTAKKQRLFFLGLVVSEVRFLVTSEHFFFLCCWAPKKGLRANVAIVLGTWSWRFILGASAHKTPGLFQGHH